jgi:CHAT domain-containing protein/tetratricopeptide (TPR) repeat protein
MIGLRSAQSAARDLADQYRRQVTGLLALFGPAGNLLARRLVDLYHDQQPLQRWWALASTDYAYWQCLTSRHPELCGAAQMAMACLLITRGLDRRGALLLQLVRPCLDATSNDLLHQLGVALNASWDELRTDLAPGIAAHDRGDYDAALDTYDDVLSRWPNHPWPWHERALTELERCPVADRRRHAAVQAVLLRDPFYLDTLAMTDPQQAAWVRTDISPLVEGGDVSPSSVTRFGAAAMRAGGDHWSAAHARILMRHLGVPFDSFLLDASLTELGVEETYDKIVALTRGKANPVATDPVDDDEGLIAAAHKEIEAQLKTGQQELAAETAAAAVTHLRQRHCGGGPLTTMLARYGLLLANLGRNIEAAAVGREILQQQAEVTDRRHVAAALSMIASSMTDRHEYAGAIRHLQQACDEYDNWPGSSLTERAVARINLGHTYELLRDYVAARRLLQQALGLLRNEFEPDLILLVRVYLPMARAEAQLGKLPRAFSLLGEAERLLEDAGPDVPVALRDDLEDTRSSLHDLIGDEENRIAVLRAMLARRRAMYGTDHPDNYRIENNLATALGAEHRDEARELLASSLRKRIHLFGEISPVVAIAYNNLALLAYQGGDYQEAVDWYEQCLRIRRQSLEATNADLLDTIAGLGACRVRLGDVPGAVPLLLEVVRTDFEVAAAAGATHTDLHFMSLRRQWVLDLLTTLVLRGTDVDGPNSNAVISALVNSKTLATGITAARPGRRTSHQLSVVATLYSALATRGPRDLPVDEHHTKLRQVGDMLDEVMAAAAGGGQAALPYIDVVARLRDDLSAEAAFVDLSAFRPTTSVPSTADAVYLGTVISDTGVEAVTELASVAEIENLVETFRDEMQMFSSLPNIPAIEEASARRVIEIGRSLYRLLFAPLESTLTRFTHLVLSLDGPMAQFPAACLVDAEGRFGIERWMFTYLSSVHDLHPLTAQRGDGDVVIFADPAYGASAEPELATGVAPLSEALTTTWTALTGTRLELQVIAEAVGADRLRSYTGHEASKTNLLRLDRPRILHLATHAFYVARPTVLVTTLDSGSSVEIGTSTDLRTGIVLAGANERRRLPDSSMDDGIVTALELSVVLDLSTTELVVLSACETAVGDMQFGDSVHGVRRACHTAGAQAVVAGLWSVTDAGSAQLMNALYIRLAATASPAEALHAATLEMLQRARVSGRTPHPHGWAAFVVSGGVQAVLRPTFGGSARHASRLAPTGE